MSRGMPPSWWSRREAEKLRTDLALLKDAVDGLLDAEAAVEGAEEWSPELLGELREAKKRLAEVRRVLRLGDGPGRL